MTVVALHANNYEDGTRGNALLREARFEGDPDAVAKALEAGLYLAVATMDGDDPLAAFLATQNDGRSWSREAPEGIVPLGAGTLDTPRGPMGYRASDTGDLFVVDGVVHAKAPTRLVRTDIAIPPDSEIRIVGGGSNVDALHGPRR